MKYYKLIIIILIGIFIVVGLFSLFVTPLPYSLVRIPGESTCLKKAIPDICKNLSGDEGLIPSSECSVTLECSIGWKGNDGYQYAIGYWPIFLLPLIGAEHMWTAVHDIDDTLSRTGNLTGIFLPVKGSGHQFEDYRGAIFYVNIGM